LEFACAKIGSIDFEVSDLKNSYLHESHRQVEKYRM